MTEADSSTEPAQPRPAVPSVPSVPSSRPSTQAGAGLRLDLTVVEALRASLPHVAERTVRAVIIEVPSYANALAGDMGQNIRVAVEVALGGFLSLVSRPRADDKGTPTAPAIEGAYALGRGEARSGRSMDALLAAYRVGARVSWREMSTTAVAAGVGAESLGRFAELVFAYIDQLSAASVAGHADELATTGQVRERYRRRLGQALLRGEDEVELEAAAERADWEPPLSLTAVVLANPHVRTVLGLLDERTLRLDDDLPHLDEALGDEVGDLAVLLVPGIDSAGARTALLRTLSGARATAGPTRPWQEVRSSYVRSLRVRRVVAPRGARAQDTEQHLAEVLLSSDPEALGDLRRHVLAPLEGETEASRERLEETLRQWLLHQGRREDVASALHVHPQTVRYRLGRLRELFGSALEEPHATLALTVALALPVTRDAEDV